MNRESGIIGLGFGDSGFRDYATPVGEALNVAFGRKFRLREKRSDRRSE